MLLEQKAHNSIAAGEAHSCKVTLNAPTKQGSLIIVIATGYSNTTSGTTTYVPGFIFASGKTNNGLSYHVYFLQNASPLNSVTATVKEDKALSVEVLEYSGMNQASAFDRAYVRNGTDRDPATGNGGSTSQPDELIIGTIVNEYASTSQSGFSGRMLKLTDDKTPSSWSHGTNVDSRRAHTTISQALPSATDSFELKARLSSTRKWIAGLVYFRGGSTGPVKMSSIKQGPLTNTDGNTSQLDVFGKLMSGIDPATPALTSTNGPGQIARIGPFVYQYLLGGWDGLLIGDDTPYTIDTIDGLEGWDIATSDDDLPRGDGSIRGIDRENARQIGFEIRIGSDSQGVPLQQADVEYALQALYHVLQPQRTDDWPLIFRHPQRPLRFVNVRPTNVVRELDPTGTVVASQKFTLRASDPRHYSAYQHVVGIGNTPATYTDVAQTGVFTYGDAMAYPLIQITNLSTADTITALELGNLSLDVGFVIETNIPPGGTLIADMQAFQIGAPTSVILVNGVSRYGAWQHPRVAWPLGAGLNQISLVTLPVGIPVNCTLTYSDTWAG